MANNGTLSADGDSDVVLAQPNPVVRVSGTWSSGTITVKYQDAGGTYRSALTTYTADFEKVFNFARPTNIKLTLSGSSSPSLVWSIQ